MVGFVVIIFLSLLFSEKHCNMASIVIRSSNALSRPIIDFKKFFVVVLFCRSRRSHLISRLAKKCFPE